MTGNRQPNLSWEIWEDNNRRTWARSFRPPLGIVTIPARSRDYRVHYGQPYFEQDPAPSKSELREAFLEGYQASGGDPVRFAQLFQVLLSGAHIATIAPPDTPEAQEGPEEW